MLRVRLGTTGEETWGVRIRVGSGITQGSLYACRRAAWRPLWPAGSEAFLDNGRPMPPPLTARLEFRTWHEGDRSVATLLWGDPVVSAFISRGGFDAEAIMRRLASEIAIEREHGVQYWPTFLREDGALAGCAGLHPHAPGVPEIGFHLRPTCWGRGLATEAAHAVIVHAFGALGAEALFAGHHPDNVASRRVLEKLGFVRTHEELYPPTGLLHPSYLLRRPNEPASLPARSG